MDILNVSRTIFDPFDGVGLSNATSSGSDYILTPAATAHTDHVGAAASTYVLTPAATGTVIHLVLAPMVYVYTASASAAVVRPVAASSTYIMTPGLDGGLAHFVAAGPTPTYIFTVAASVIGGHLVAAHSTYLFTPAGGGPVPEPHTWAASTYIMTAYASAVVVTQECQPLGRYRRGDVVVVELDLPYLPDSPPLAMVFGSGTTPDEVFALAEVFPLGRDFSSQGVFAAELFVDGRYLPGHHRIVFQALAGGQPDARPEQCFDVVPGGDPAGAVIALACYQRGKSQDVLAHTSAGLLLLGKNPSLDRTSPPRVPSGADSLAVPPILVDASSLYLLATHGQVQGGDLPVEASSAYVLAAHTVPGSREDVGGWLLPVQASSSYVLTPVGE